MTRIEALVIAAIVALVVGSPLLTGWLLWKAWEFVAVPVFHAPPLTYWQAVVLGIALWVIGGMFKAAVTVEAKR